jgi:hypothetical protein
MIFFQKSVNSNWLPLPASQVPFPRPGLCYNSSSPLTETSLHFIKDHCLMDKSVGATPPTPVFLRAGIKERFTQIAVDKNIVSATGKTYDILFIGTDTGAVYRVLLLKHSSLDVPSALVLDKLQVFSDPVKNLLIVKQEGSSPQLVVLSDDELKAVPLDSCDIEASTPWEGCPQCLALRSPYCMWDLVSSACLPVSQRTEDNVLQELETGFSPNCPSTPPPPPTSTLPPETPQTSIEETG